jgi:hypothetical protein
LSVHDTIVQLAAVTAALFAAFVTMVALTGQASKWLGALRERRSTNADRTP